VKEIEVTPPTEIKTPLPICVEESTERILFSCSCWDPGHHLFILEDKGEDDLYLEVRLNKYAPFLVRLWVGFKYIFGLFEPDYDTVILSKENRLKLGKLLLINNSTKTKKQKSSIIPKKPRKISAIKIKTDVVSSEESRNLEIVGKSLLE